MLHGGLHGSLEERGEQNGTQALEAAASANITALAALILSAGAIPTAVLCAVIVVLQYSEGAVR